MARGATKTTKLPSKGSSAASGKNCLDKDVRSHATKVQTGSSQKSITKPKSLDGIETALDVQGHVDKAWKSFTLTAEKALPHACQNSLDESQSRTGQTSEVQGSSASIYQLRTSVNEALKPFLMEVIDCKDTVNFEDDLKHALGLDKAMELRAGFTLLEREKLRASDVLMYQDLYPGLILKLIIWFGISRLTNAAEWLRYQVETYYGSDSVTDTFKIKVEQAIFRIFQWLGVSDQEKEKIFEIRPYSDIDVIAIMDLITFFNEKHGHKDVYSEIIEDDDQKRIELKQHVLKAIEMEESFLKGESDVDVQLRKILPKYTYLRAINKRNLGSVGAKLMPNILVKNLVRCKELDNDTSKMVGPYFAWKILNEMSLELLDDAMIDDPEWCRYKLEGLPDANPSEIRSPKKWRDSAVLINAVCQYYNFVLVRGEQRLEESELKKHNENIALLLKKLHPENRPSELITESIGRKMLVDTVMNIARILTQEGNLTVDEEKGAGHGGASSYVQMSGKDFRALNFRKIAEDLQKVGQYADALQLHEQVLGMLIETKNSDEASVSRYHVALCQWNLGNHKEAIETLETALRDCNRQADPSFMSKVTITYASFLIHEGKLAEAKRELSCISEGAVSRWRYHFALGSLHLICSEYDLAIGDFMKALHWLEKKKNRQSLSVELVLSAMATVYLKKDMLAEAQSEYQKIFDRMKLRNLVSCAVQQIEDLWYSLEYALKNLKFESEAMQIHEKLSEVWHITRRRSSWVGITCETLIAR